MIYTHSLSFGPKLFDAWDEIDQGGNFPPGIRTLAKHDRFYLLVKVCGRADLLHPWLYARCREVEANPDGYLDLWARYHYKSTIITFAGVLQEIINDPEVTIGIFSHTKGIAQGFLMQIMRELEKPALKTLFPDIFWETPERQAPSWSLQSGLIVKRVTNPKESTVEAHGLVDSQPVGKHFRLMVYDDVVTKDSVATPDQVEKTTESWEHSDNLSTIGGRKWHIGTRYSFADTYDAIIRKGVVKTRFYPATHNGTIAGRPVFFSEDEWRSKVMSQSDSVLSCQMLQNPLGGKQGFFDLDKHPLPIYEIRPGTLNVYITCDPARSKKKGSANSAYSVIGVDAAMNKYLLDGLNHKMDLAERWDALKMLYTKWTTAPGVQSVKVGYESSGALADLDYFRERMTKDKRTFDIVELAWPRDGDGSKDDRVQRLVPDIKGARLYLPYPTDPKAFTSVQRALAGTGQNHRIAQKIRARNEDGVIYDLCEHLLEQIRYYPFGPLKDLIDAVSRIYDMEITPPYIVPTESLEPEYT